MICPGCEQKTAKRTGEYVKLKCPVIKTVYYTCDACGTKFDLDISASNIRTPQSSEKSLQVVLTHLTKLTPAHLKALQNLIPDLESIALSEGEKQTFRV